MGDLTLSMIMYDYRLPFAMTRSETHSYALEVRSLHIAERASTIRKLIKSSPIQTLSGTYCSLDFPVEHFIHLAMRDSPVYELYFQ